MTTIPRPPFPLTDICSVIYNNTLYTYSAGAFQSLRLEPGAQWKRLSQGVPVTGAVCVGTTPVAPREPGFFVVGGKGPAGYLGLQKYTYATGKWETVIPVSPVTQDRVGHGAIYINNTDTILIYAGNQDGSTNPSTQTFTIGASAPYDVLSYQGAPPCINPILLPWGADQAVMVGGNAANKDVMLFSSDGGWKDSGASLSAPLPKDTVSMRAAIVNGDDGSKVLYTFDMSLSPNRVSRTVLIDGQGKPLQDSAPVSARSLQDGAKIVPTLGEDTERRRVKRLTSDKWPQYNATYAPTSLRTNAAVAEDSNGMIVIAGGNSDDVLEIFDGRQNKWESPALFFAEQEVLMKSETTSSAVSSATPTSSSSISVSASATPSLNLASSSTQTTSAPSQSSTTGAGAVAGAATSSAPSVASPTTILAAVLGTTAAVLLLLGILFCLLRRKKKRQVFVEAGHNRRSSGTSSTEKEDMACATESFPRSPTTGIFRGHQQQDSHASLSSMAILMGRVNQQTPTMVERQPSKQSKRSSTSSILNQAFKNSISKPIPQSPNPFADTVPPPYQDDSNDNTHIEKGVSFRQDVVKPRPRPARPEGAGPDGTRRSSGWNRYWSGGSTLNILGFGSGASRRTTVESTSSSRYSQNQPFTNRVTQDSATVPALSVNRMPPPPTDVMAEPKPEFNRVNSGSPTISQYSQHLKEGMSGRIERPSSSASSASGYSSGIPASVHEAWDPTGGREKAWGADRAPSSAYNSAYISTYSTSLAPATANIKPLPTGVSTQPQLAMAATSSDMSWLNLGDSGNNSRL